MRLDGIMTSVGYLVAAALALWTTVGAAGLVAQRATDEPGVPAKTSGEYEVLRINGIDAVHVQGNVYALFGAGANIAVSVGEEGTLLVDSGNAASSDKVLAVLRALSNRPLQYILNTQYGEDHTGGNEPLAKTGWRLKDNGSNQAVVIAHENTSSRMTGPTGVVSPRPLGAWPTDTFFSKLKEVYFNREPVQMFFRPGPTDGDAFVFFRKSDVIAAGDLFLTTSYPIINMAAGGHINGILEGLNDIIDLTVPSSNVEDGTLVIPGHGRLSDELDVAVYRDMVTIIRDRVKDAIDHGRSVEQVKADKRITLEYEGRYGSKTGPWTTDMFLDAVYRNLTTK